MGVIGYLQPAQYRAAGTGAQALFGAPGTIDRIGYLVDPSQHTALVRTRLRRMQYRPGLLSGFLASTCLDLTLLFCATLEQAGLNPIMVFM